MKDNPGNVFYTMCETRTSPDRWTACLTADSPVGNTSAAKAFVVSFSMPVAGMYIYRAIKQARK